MHASLLPLRYEKKSGKQKDAQKDQKEKPDAGVEPATLRLDQSPL
jgi:hypothetical protein